MADDEVKIFTIISNRFEYNRTQGHTHRNGSRHK